MSASLRIAAATALLAASAPLLCAQAQAQVSVVATPSPSVPSRQPTSAASAGAPRAGYVSAFEGYRRYAEQPVGAWREANRLVGGLGGWKAYAREGQSDAQTSGSASASTPAPSVRDAMEAGPADHSAHPTGAAKP